jgi:hypothetical protein
MLETLSMRPLTGTRFADRFLPSVGMTESGDGATRDAIVPNTRGTDRAMDEGPVRTGTWQEPH